MIEANLKEFTDDEITEIEQRAERTANMWSGGYPEALKFQYTIARSSLASSYDPPF